MPDLLPAAVAALAGTLVGVVVALWLGRQQRRAHQRLLVREHQRALVLEVLEALRVLEVPAAGRGAAPRDQHEAACRERQDRLRRVEDQLLVAPLSPALVVRARAALEAAERSTAYGARAHSDGHAELARERALRRQDFVETARRELRLRRARRAPRPVEAREGAGPAPRRALG